MSEYADTAVLLVDDDESSVILAAKMLNRAGFRHVDTALSASAALELMQGREYRLIMTDWNMPGMNGLELLKTIRADERLNRTPVLLMSIDDGAERVGRAALAGANAFLPKPFDRPTLKATIDQVL